MNKIFRYILFMAYLFGALSLSAAPKTVLNWVSTFVANGEADWKYPSPTE